MPSDVNISVRFHNIYNKYTKKSTNAYSYKKNILQMCLLFKSDQSCEPKSEDN